MSERFFAYCSDFDSERKTVRISGPEANHLCNVMRKTAGDEVVIFDGGGDDYRAAIVSAKKNLIELEISEIIPGISGPRVEITIAVSLPKGDRQKWMLEKLTELGCERLIPLETVRGVAKADPGVVARLERQVVEAMKQCGRSRIMKIENAMSLKNLDSWLEKDEQNFLKLTAHPGAEFSLNETLIKREPERVIFAVGPEGGFASEELDFLDSNGWNRVALGPYILRIETAAIAACAGCGVRDSGCG